MTSNFTEDQAKQLRKRLENNEKDPAVENKEIDILSLPSRKEKYKKTKQTRPEKNGEIEQTQKQTKRVRRRRVKFPLVQILLFMFLLLVILVITYPSWIERLNL